MNDDDLRKEVRILKAIGQIDNYAEVAEMIEITKNSFYNWLNGYYNLSSDRKKLLNIIVDDLSL